VEDCGAMAAVLDFFAKLGNFRHVRPSVRTHGTTRLPTNRFSLHLTSSVYFFGNLSRKFKVRQNLTRTADTDIHEDARTFMTSH